MVRFLAGAIDFPLLKVSRLALGLIEAAIKWVSELFLARLTTPGRQSHHLRRLVSRLGINTVIPPLPYRPSWRTGRQFSSQF